MSNLLDGFATILTAENLLWLLVGVLVGMVIGVLPGLGSVTGMVMLFPIAFTLDPVPAIAMLAAVYYGVMYGSTITSVLVNLPGNDVSIATTFDGYPMARQGRAGPALVVSTVGSFFAGTFGLIVFTLAATILTGVATSLGPVEFFLLIAMAVLAIALVVAEDVPRGLASAFLGVMLATVGVDVVSGQPRFTFEQPELLSGVGFIAVTIGLFAVGEVLDGLYEGRHRGRLSLVQSVAFWPSRPEWRASRLPIARGSVLGFLLGILPGAGGTLASLSSYFMEKGLAKDRSRFGKGAIEGVAGPEAANNATTSGAMVPMLTLGIPASTGTAVLLAAIIAVGIAPGSQLLVGDPDFAWSFIASMYTGNVILVLLSLFAIPLFARIALVPYGILAPVIVVVAAVGAYLATETMFSVWVMFAAGVVGFFMRRFGFSPAATVMAFVLTPLAETALRQSLIIGDGSFGVFWERPVARYLVIALVLLILAKPVSTAVRRLIRRGQVGTQPDVDTDVDTAARQ